MKIGVMFPNFKLEGKIPVSSIEWFIQFFKHSNVNSLSFNICIGISPPADLLVFKSLILLLTSFVVTGRYENLLIFLYYFFIFFMLGWLINFFIIPLTLFLWLITEWLLRSSYECSRLRFSKIEPKWFFIYLFIYWHYFKSIQWKIVKNN